MTAAFNSVLSYPPYPNNKYLCILDDVATHARAITNQLTLFRQKKGNHSVSRAVGFNIQNGFDFWRDKERGERERERERDMALPREVKPHPTASSTLPANYEIYQLWYEPLI